MKIVFFAGGDAADPIRNSLNERECSMWGPLSIHQRQLNQGTVPLISAALLSWDRPHDSEW